MARRAAAQGWFRKMLKLGFKESGSSLDDNVSALIVELEKLAGRAFERQAHEDRPTAGGRTSRERRQAPPSGQWPHRSREVPRASGIEQSISDARLSGPRHRRDQRRSRHQKRQRPSQAASGSSGQVQNEAEAMAAIKSLADDLVRACEEAGFEVTGSSGSAGSGKA
jgi:hypothetical protein